MPKTGVTSPDRPQERQLQKHQPSDPDPLILHRVYQLWDVTGPWGNREVTTAWCARLLVRLDGGPPPDAGQLGPALRLLGYRPVRRRRGARRVNAWLVPGSPPARVGRPYAQGRDGDHSVWSPHCSRMT